MLYMTDLKKTPHFIKTKFIKLKQEFMAEDKRTIVVYSDWQENFESLSDEEAGRLIKHFFKYVNDEDPVPVDRITEISFIPLKNALKRDLKKWELELERRSINGRLGNLKRWNIDLFYRVESGEITLEEAESIANSRKPSLPDKKETGTTKEVAIIADTVNENVNENDILLIKETKEEKIIKKKFNFKGSLISIGVSEQIASDWMEVRKNKRASNTETAFKTLLNEINKTGLSPNDCIEEAVSRSWQGFKAKWLNNNFDNGQEKQQQFTAITGALRQIDPTL
jgi:hypothetical protein